MRLFLVILLCLLAFGCRSKPRVNRQTALLRAEFLDLEDKYYLLKSKYEGVMSQLGEDGLVGDAYYDGDIIYEGDVILDNFAPIEGQQYGDNGIAPSDPSINSPNGASSTPGTSSDVRSVVQPPVRSGETLNSPEQQSEVISPENSEPLPVPKSNSDQLNLMLNAPGNLNSSDIEISFPRVINDDVDITEIVINRKTTRGQNVDGNPGDDGIDLLVQPKTADGLVEFQSGELTISVIDTAERADQQRIGLWKFLPEETKLFFASDEQGNRGILLHLPWDQSTPVNEKLDLHVRFITNDGRILKTSGTLRIKPPAQGYSAKHPDVARWTRHDSRWIPDPAPQMRTDDGAGWLGRAGPSTERQAFSRPANSGSPPARRLIPSSSAKAEIERPTWRPIR